MNDQPADARLAKLYAQLQQRRARTGAEPELPVETIYALASGSYAGADRISLLAAVLRDPDLAREFQFLRDLAAAAPVGARRFRRGTFALAAGIGVVSLAGILWLLAQRGTAPDALRGSARVPVLIAPAGGAAIGAGERLLWHAVLDAAEYRVEIADSEGVVVFAETLRDSLTSIPDTTRLLPAARYLWWVTATRNDGTASRSTPIAVRGRVP